MVGDGANGKGMRSEHIGAGGDEAQKDVLARLPRRLGRDGDAERVWRLASDTRRVADAVAKIGVEKGKQKARNIEGNGGDEVVPGRETEAAMNKKEDDENESKEEMSCLEQLIKLVAINLLAKHPGANRKQTCRIQEMDMKVSHACATRAITPVIHTPPVTNAVCTSCVTSWR